jgi:hypothetical protein
MEHSSSKEKEHGSTSSGDETETPSLSNFSSLSSAPSLNLNSTSKEVVPELKLSNSFGRSRSATVGKVTNIEVKAPSTQAPTPQEKQGGEVPFRSLVSFWESQRSLSNPKPPPPPPKRTLSLSRGLTNQSS